MHLIAIAWMYVVVMMAVAEAFSPRGTVLGALMTLVFYGVLPLALLLYLLNTPHRKRAARAAERSADGSAQAARPDEPAPAHGAATGSAPPGSGTPDQGGDTPGDAIPPVRKEV